MDQKNRLNELFGMLGMDQYIQKPDEPGPTKPVFVAERDKDGKTPDFGEDVMAIHSSWFQCQNIEEVIKNLQGLVGEMTANKMGVIMKNDAKGELTDSMNLVQQIVDDPLGYAQELKDELSDDEDSLKALAAMCQLATIGITLTMYNACEFAKNHTGPAHEAIDQHFRRKEQTDNN